MTGSLLIAVGYEEESSRGVSAARASEGYGVQQVSTAESGPRACQLRASCGRPLRSSRRDAGIGLAVLPGLAA